MGEFKQRRPVRYEQQRAIVRFCSPVDANSIFALCDEIDLALDYYLYPRVTIEIDSPGGEVRSLIYYIQKLKGWRKRQVAIETVALTQCSSAAAFMLSLGDLGKRNSMPRAMLLYHNARIYSSAQQPLTSDQLDKLRTILSQTDAEMLVSLLRHLYGQLGEECFACLEELVGSLPYSERTVRADHFQVLSVPRLEKRLRAMNHALGDANLHQRLELYRLITRHLSKCCPETITATNMGSLSAFLNAQPVTRHHEMKVAWLYGQFEHFKAIFARDTPICPEDALKEGLIDAICE